jgi:hypothetical protein
VSKPSDSLAEDVVKKYNWDQIRRFTNGLTSRQLGKEVAVKILDPSSQQGMPEFLNEVLF